MGATPAENDQRAREAAETPEWVKVRFTFGMLFSLSEPTPERSREDTGNSPNDDDADSTRSDSLPPSIERSISTYGNDPVSLKPGTWKVASSPVLSEIGEDNMVWFDVEPVSGIQNGQMMAELVGIVVNVEEQRLTAKAYGLNLEDRRTRHSEYLFSM